MLVDCFHKILRHRRWIQTPGIILTLLLIMLAFLTIVQQRRDPKMQPRRVQQARAHITTLTRSIPNAYNIFRIRSSGPFICTCK